MTCAGAAATGAGATVLAERIFQLGKQVRLPNHVTLPADLAAGNYVLTVVIDTDNAFAEQNEANNSIVSSVFAVGA